MTKEDCCASNAAAATAYSEEDLDSGSLFFWRVLGGGVQCRPCRGKRIFNFICFYLNFLKKKNLKILVEVFVECRYLFTHLCKIQIFQSLQNSIKKKNRRISEI